MTGLSPFMSGLSWEDARRAGKSVFEDCPEGWDGNSAQALISSRFSGLRLDVSGASMKEF